jgi:hypothetical protein
MAKKTTIGSVAQSTTEAVATALDALAHPLDTANNVAANAINDARRPLERATKRIAGKGARKIASGKRRSAAKKGAAKKAARKVVSRAKPTGRNVAKKVAGRRKHR